MSNRFDAAVHELELVCPDLNEVVRVDVDDAGALTLTANDVRGMRWFTHDDRGLIEHFPDRDPKLPLAKHLSESDDWKVLSYRPRRRMVVLKSRGESTSVLKGHKKSRSARAAVYQGFAEGAMRRGAFRVPRLLRHDGRHEALVFEFLQGSEIDLDAGRAPQFERLGRLLVVFQDDESARDLAFFGPRDELQVLEKWREKVLRVVNTLPEGWLEARERLERSAGELPPAHLGLCHRDLHDRQIHLCGEEIALLDFDLLCRADVALDAGNLVAHLRWRAVQGVFGAGATSTAALESAFLEGLGRTRERGFAHRLSFYTASTFLRLALVYRLRPRWAGQVSGLVSWANEVLDDLAPTH